MVKKISLALIYIFWLACIPACQKAPINGDLDGRWQIMEIEKNGETFEVKESQLYYNFSLHVCMLTYYGGQFTDGNMKYDGQTITMDFPYVKTTGQYAILKQYGIYSNPVTFTVEFHGKDRMTLYNSDSTISLRKF